MAIIKKNPNLPDYFREVRGVALGAQPSAVPNIVGLYEDAKVLWYPELKPSIDAEFWASLDTRSLPALKKLSTLSNLDGSQDQSSTTTLITRLEKGGVERGLAVEIARHMSSLLEQVMPLYQPLFGGYRFIKGRVVWRLQDIYAENLHLDAYLEPNPNHFARMFINLDTQPRIWHTSWQAEDVIRIAKARVPRQDATRLSANDLWASFNGAVFGKTSREWWDDQPRHIAFFEPDFLRQARSLHRFRCRSGLDALGGQAIPASRRVSQSQHFGEPHRLSGLGAWPRRRQRRTQADC